MQRFVTPTRRVGWVAVPAQTTPGSTRFRRK
jgi:hypothetical protein